VRCHRCFVEKPGLGRDPPTAKLITHQPGGAWSRPYWTILGANGDQQAKPIARRKEKDGVRPAGLQRGRMHGQRYSRLSQVVAGSTAALSVLGNVPTVITYPATGAGKVIRCVKISGIEVPDNRS
ncbi:MAG UNVERIFIED_CONTAM: hypothetical protein MIN83_26190, partial [Paenibacillus polymyxa]